ncbi:oligosaccharide flippase family protein [Metabacillus herbersteinensis]|uniref:Oligosaccharide flippase family protein n=1 Tax=Metabacillus herbersteinensis TaxID=283816 RepID=A0ABV6GKQ9_9BACI
MNSEKQSAHLILQGAILLTIAGLLTKILSAAYRIPYQNIVGDIGFYIYQQIYPFYGMAVMFATTGFPVIISKLLTDYNVEKNDSIRSKVLTVTMLFLVVVGIMMFIILFLGAEIIAKIMGDPPLKILIQVISFSFLLVPFISFFRGYFQGNQQMYPTAISQVAEQGIRVGSILVISYILIQNGYTLYEAGAGALFGSLTGGLTALALLAFFWFKTNQHVTFKWSLTANVQSTDIIMTLLKYSFTIGFSSLLLILIQLIDSLHLYSLLVSNGVNETVAKESKGVYDRGQPLIQLGTVVATSFALSLVPIIAKAKKENNEEFIHKKVNLSLKICIVFGVAATVGLIAIIKPTNVMLFMDQSGNLVLSILSLSILFTSLSLTLTAILQGLGHTVYPALAVTVGLLVKFVLNLMLIPFMETVGAAISTVLAYFSVVVVLIIIIRKKKYRLRNSKSIKKIAIAVFVMLTYLVLSTTFLEFFLNSNDRGQAAFIALSGVTIGGICYLFLIVALGVFTNEELVDLPFGSKLLLFLTKLKWGK